MNLNPKFEHLSFADLHSLKEECMITLQQSDGLKSLFLGSAEVKRSKILYLKEEIEIEISDRISNLINK